MSAARLIFRLTLDFSVADQDEATAVQARLAPPLLDRLSSFIEAAGSAAVAVDQVLRIDRLELDLGVLSLAEFETELLDGVARRLPEALARYGLPTSEESGCFNCVLTLTENRLELLLNFLASGRMPWWADAATRSAPANLLEPLLVADPNGIAGCLADLPLTPILSRRLARQFEPALVRLLLQAMVHMNGLAARLEELARHRAEGELSASFARLRSERRVNEESLLALLHSGAAGLHVFLDAASEVVAPQRQAEDARPALLNQAASSSRQPGTDFSHMPTDEPAGARRAPAPLGATSDGLPELSSRMVTPVMNQSSDLYFGGETHSRLTDETSWTDGVVPGERSTPPRDPLSPEPSKNLARDALQVSLVSNAGLVLLWPFLPRFFAALGLLDGKDFRAVATREQGALLLQYLASGELETPESELPLNKLLTGLPLEHPLPRELLIDAAVVAECEELQLSLIRHWDALGTTSVAGLRASLLLRQGRLEPSAQGWRLNVPRAGYDVLLDRLPWGIGFVLLPWMTQPLFVEW